MTATIGTFALGLALAVALYGCVASFVGARKRNAVLVESARTCALSLFALVLAANGAMLAAILSNDFTLKYVAENSSRATPTFFKVLSLWSADEGSLLDRRSSRRRLAHRSPWTWAPPLHADR